MKSCRFSKIVRLLVAVVFLFILESQYKERVFAQQGCRWVGVERAGINSHQKGGAWCPPGTFLVAFDLDSNFKLCHHDSPIVGQAMCCPDYTMSYRWGSTTWVGVETKGINSHQPGPAWCPNGMFLVAFDLDGPRNYSPWDSPVVGQALCASPVGTGGSGWGQCLWVGVETRGISSHQPGPAWCPNGMFLVAFDLDGPRNISPWDAPVVGQALCCRPR
jgi:hypothetical protein